MLNMVKAMLVILILPFILANSISALTPPLVSPTPSPLPSKVDYILPYPGILPDHPLYTLKMLRDRIMDLLTSDPIKKTEFLILMADKRIGAGKALIDGNKVELGQTTISKAENYFNRALESAGLAKQKKQEVNSLLERLEKSSQKHMEVLEELLLKAPESIKPGLNNALENEKKGYQEILKLKAL